MIETEEFLEHFGVKGMHWGHRQASDSSGGGSSRNNKRIAKATAKVEKVANKQKESDARDKTILDARKNVEKTAGQLKVAKAQYKLDKIAKGKPEAKKILNKVKDVHSTNLYNANLSTAKELVDAQREATWNAIADGLNKFA